MSRLVLLRHGQTAWNAVTRAQGHADIELDAIGREQARAVAPAIAKYDPTHLWTSDLRRATETAEAVADATGLTPLLDARLREYDVGVRTGLTTTEFAAAYPEEYAAWVRGLESPPVPGAELSEDVRRRLGPALRECLDSLGEGETGVVVMHGAALKVAVMDLLDWTWEVASTLRGVDNCAWVEIVRDGIGRLRLVRYNAQA